MHARIALGLTLSLLIAPFSYPSGTLTDRERSPIRLRSARASDRLAHLRFALFGNFAENFASGWIFRADRAARLLR